MWLWLVLALCGALVAAAFLYWALVITEGAYLGSRAVAWTYDLSAKRYDRIKQFNPTEDAWFLAIPMLKALEHVDCPLVLDVATGTGRMLQALLERPLFRGTVVGLDLSYRMLQQAHTKLLPHAGRYTLVWRDAQSLPFPDETFDAVACLEALEFMPSPQRVLQEMTRVLRPGGALLVTNRVNWERSLMPGKAFTDDQLRPLLQAVGLIEISFRPWQVYYDLVWARKPGAQSRLGRGTWHTGEIVSCPHCTHHPMLDLADRLRCPACAHEYPTQGSIFPLRS